jgi:hypothetical protein
MSLLLCFEDDFLPVLRLWLRVKLFDGDRAASRYGSGGSGSDNRIEHDQELKNDSKCNSLYVYNHSVHIFSNINRTELYEQDGFPMCLNFRSF